MTLKIYRGFLMLHFASGCKHAYAAYSVLYAVFRCDVGILLSVSYSLCHQSLLVRRLVVLSAAEEHWSQRLESQFDCVNISPVATSSFYCVTVANDSVH